jgi:hypothetical protein
VRWGNAIQSIFSKKPPAPATFYAMTQTGT